VRIAAPREALGIASAVASLTAPPRRADLALIAALREVLRRPTRATASFRAKATEGSLRALDHPLKNAQKSGVAL
jgi:hypothetical protein